MSSSLSYFSLHHSFTVQSTVHLTVYLTVQHTLNPDYLIVHLPVYFLAFFGFCWIIEFCNAASVNFPTVAPSKRKWPNFRPLFPFSPLQIWEHFAGAAAAGLGGGQGAVGRAGDVRGWPRQGEGVHHHPRHDGARNKAAHRVHQQDQLLNYIVPVINDAKHSVQCTIKIIKCFYFKKWSEWLNFMNEIIYYF